MADFTIKYKPQSKQKLYHSYGSGKFIKYMKYFYDGFPLEDKIKMEAPLQERIERLKRGDITITEQYIMELDNLVNEVGYGGSRGGGKSYADAGEAAMDANIFPGVKIGIFRQTYAALNESITEKLLEMLPRDLKDKPRIGWKYVKKDNRIDFFHNESVIKLCYCESYNDALKYRGFEFDILIIDEEADLDNKTVNFLKGILRTAKFIKYEDGSHVLYPEGHEKYLDADGERVVVNYPTLYMFSCNPEGPGFIRVRDEYVRPTEYGKKIVEMERILKSGKKVIRRKAFVQANMSDNKYINDDYELQFEGMTEAEIAKNVDGDWEISDSNFFTSFIRKEHELKTFDEYFDNYQLDNIRVGEEFPIYWDCFGALDWGYNPDYAALSIFYVGENSVVKRHEIRWWKKTISEAAEFILEKQDELGFKIKMLAIPHDMAKEGEIYRNTKGEVLGITKEKVLRKFGIPTLVTRASRIDGWDMLHDLMSLRREDDEKPVYRVHKSCIITMNGYETIAKDNNKKGDIKEGQEDHFPDSDRYFAVMYNTFIHPKRKEERKQKSFREQVQERAIAKRTTIRKYNAYSSR